MRALVFVGVCLCAIGSLADDTPTSSERVLDFDPDWTPRPVEGDVPWYMKEKDPEWVDDRLRRMITGPTWNATFRYAERGATPTPEDDPASSADKPARTHRSFKGTAIRLGDQGEASMIFDRNQCRWACGWTGDFLWHSDRRFGLLNTPIPAGDVLFATTPGAGWSRDDGTWSDAPAATGPLPREWAHFMGMNRHGVRTALLYEVNGTRIVEVPWIEHHGPIDVFTRTVAVYPHADTRQMLICETFGREVSGQEIVDAPVLSMTDEDGTTAVTLVNGPEGCVLKALKSGRIVLELSPTTEPAILKIGMTHGEDLTRESFGAAIDRSPHADMSDVVRWLDPGPPLWTDLLKTVGDVAEDDGPLVIDTITVPYDNPYNALFFLSGVDFLPTGEVIVCTVHGDVWIVTGVDDELNHIVWKRFATGLYQPLGLKVVDGKIHVLERGQLTRLHDNNEDGEADVYESVNADWHVGGGEHSYDTCLETDPDGNWYFHSTGDPDTPTGGTLVKVSADGQSSEVFCTGFRHPIGMGVLPDGRITGADQEGNWMPSTRIDIYRQGGFYGDMRAHHRGTPPETYDRPLCWLPRQLDGSAGGQITVPAGHWGPLGGRTLHMSFGKCRMMLLMMQQIGGVEQAGAIDLGLQFIAGIQRGRFRPKDGHLYVVGMDGWQTAAVVDGCLQRVRSTGQDFRIPLELKVAPQQLRITFTTQLDPQIAADKERYHIEQWNYRWQEEYGSPRYSVADPETEGQDDVAIESVEVVDQGFDVILTVPELQPVMQMQIDYRLEDRSGNPVDGVIYNTVHTTGEEVE